jgi:DNA uptake protein ComE-like DNA-binding protein
LAEGTCGIGVVATLPDGTATTNSGLVDEESKVNLNAAKPPLLAALLETAGGMAPAAAADAAAAMADWVDPDHEVLTGGAEDDYYARLEQPYDCHDGSFQSVYELRLVRGIGAEVLARIADKVTVFGTGKININTASAEVLRAVAVASGGVRDVADALAARILRFRDAGNVFGKSGGAGDVSRQLGEFEALRPGEAELLRRMAPYLGVYSSCFGGSAWGRAGAGPGGESRIEFVFERDTRQTVFWHEF